MARLVLPVVLATGLAGCGPFLPGGQDPATGATPAAVAPATDFAPAAANVALGASSASAAALDSTTPAEKVAALSAPAAAGERRLGQAVAALGPPAEQGLWLSSPLVERVGQGRVVSASGQSLALELRPGTGATLLSLAAYQALNLSLAALEELTVYGQ
jgi:hypothetical protein